MKSILVKLEKRFKYDDATLLRSCREEIKRLLQERDRMVSEDQKRRCVLSEKQLRIGYLSDVIEKVMADVGSTKLSERTREAVFKAMPSIKP
jgi:hypothetical protein